MGLAVAIARRSGVRWAFGLVLTLLVMGGVELLHRLGLETGSPEAILLIAVAAAALIGGGSVGLASGLLSLLYLAASVSRGGRLTELTVRESLSLIEVAAVMFVMVLMIVWLRSCLTLGEKNRVVREQGLLLQAMLRHVSLGVVVAEGDEGRVRMISRYAMESAGQSEGEYIGRAARDLPFRFFEPEGQEQIAVEQWPLMRALKFRETICQKELYLMEREGRWATILCTACPIGEKDIIGGVMVWQDISEHRRAEAAVRDSERRLREMADAMPQIVWTADKTGNVDYVNRRWIEQTGLPVESGHGLEWQALIHPDDLQRNIDTLHRCMATGEPVDEEYRLRSRDGSYRWHIVRAEPVCDETGAVCRWYGTCTDIHEKKQVMEALRESEQGLREMADSMPQIVWIADANANVFYVNRRWIEQTGTPVEAGYGLDWRALVHPDDIGYIMEAWRRCIATGQSMDEEFRLRKSDGSYRWYIVRGEPVFDEGGRTIKWYGTCTDIHDKKQVMEALRESEEIFRTLAENANAIIGIVLGRRFVYANPQLEVVSGYSREELIDMDIAKMVHPDWRNAVEERARRRQAGEIVPTRYEFVMVTKSGESRWLDFAAGRITYKGEPAVVGIAQDVTERKHWEEALREREEALRLALEAAEMGVWKWDVESGALTWSCKVRALLGTDQDRPVRFEHFLERVHEEDRAHVVERINQSLAEEVDYDDEFRITRPDGVVLWLLAKGRAIRENGQVKLMIGVTMDITARKEAEGEMERVTAELARSNKELEEFASVASHDLQEPLRMVSGFLELTLSRCRGKVDQEVEEFMGLALDGAWRMQRLIQDLLVYSRVGTQSIEATRVSMETAMEQAVANLRRNIRESEAEISYDHMPQVMGDLQQLTRLLQNLLANALKFRRVEERPRIHVGARREGGEWLFEVRDNGIGIEQRFSERIFQVFQRLHGREEYPGTGIGLAICKKIVERHRGRIWVESAPMEGSRFYFTLPAAD